MKLVDLSIKRPVGVVMIVVLALVLGVISVRGLVVDLFPEIDFPVAAVTTTYDGAAPEEMEELVTRHIEAAVGSIEGVDSIQSVSSPNSSLVILLFDYGTNIDNAINDMRNRIDQVSGLLPEDANDPTVMKFDPQAIPIMTVSLTGDSLQNLQLVAEDEVQPMLERVPGVGSVTIEGGIEREIRIALNQNQLSNYGITGSQVVQALGGENRAVSAGTVQRGNQELQLRIDGEFTSIQDIENTQISLPNGGTIRVSDVAEVIDTFKDQNMVSLVNGEEVIMFTIMKQSDGNTVQVADGVERVLANLNSSLAERDLQLTKIMDTSTIIRDSINSVVNNLITGGVLSVLVLLLFLRNIRTTLVIGLSIPIAIISTFTLMYFTGQTLNILSMAGLALGIGMMVDSSIVILENIFKKRQEGMLIREAAFVGGSELASSVIASTLTTAVVFLPFVFTSGLAAEMFQPLALTVVFSLTASLICALTLVPMLSSKFLGNAKVSFDGEESDGLVDRGLNKLRDVYTNILRKALNFRKTVVLIVMGLFLGSLALTPLLGTELMPTADDGAVAINVELQVGTQLSETGLVVDQINTVLADYDNIINTNYISIGGGATAGGPVQAVNSHIANLSIQLISSTEREMTTTAFVKEVNDSIENLGIPGTKISVEHTGGGFSTGAPISISITGDDLDVLSDIAQQVVWILEDVDGTINVSSSAAEGRPQVEVVVDRQLANQYGLSYQSVMNEVSLGFNGQVATRYKEDGNEYDVRVLLPEDSTQTVRDLETMMIRNNQGMNVPLTTIASLKQTQGPAEISREDQQRGVQVTSDVAGRDLGSVNRDIQAELSRLSLPDGYAISVGGETEQMTESFVQLGFALVLGIFLIYMVMAVQFESFMYPFIIMFSLPTMIIGAIAGLLVANVPLSMPAMTGLILLAGIVVNNGIILVDYINILRARGMERFEAIVESGRSRLRPILMTTFTTVLGMVPLAMAFGEGAETNQPMAVVVVFGLLSSTVFTLVFVPVMYVIIDNIAMRLKGLFKRKKNEEDLEELEFGEGHEKM
ncbi:efflux RND transporter permease subunit [Halalkalibacter nanhaiisediminis]|uniref:HAE1 family hydrophobic/amphiphilic exporter-1 n=1 Tax=Halalkalibacter nanhaiisediminis TaxID=688079 RepID=A0A562QT09_9BACI|nr:efflux RND transporter permease subunit [Halalkalibacter nanhaiisediminis]TWI59827.1 HAE1 family hydrophobic/amphiphilic exporter-1 [Halalkalibacter nanhaiisediminis]